MAVRVACERTVRIVDPPDAPERIRTRTFGSVDGSAAGQSRWLASGKSDWIRHVPVVSYLRGYSRRPTRWSRRYRSSPRGPVAPSLVRLRRALSCVLRIT